MSEDLFNYAYHTLVAPGPINRTTHPLLIKVEIEEPIPIGLTPFSYSQEIINLDERVGETNLSISFKNLIYVHSEYTTSPGEGNLFRSLIFLQQYMDYGPLQDYIYGGQWFLNVKLVLRGEKPYPDIKCENVEDFVKQGKTISEMISEFQKSIEGNWGDPFVLAPTYLSKARYES